MKKTMKLSILTALAAFSSFSASVKCQRVDRSSPLAILRGLAGGEDDQGEDEDGDNSCGLEYESIDVEPFVRH